VDINFTMKKAHKEIKLGFMSKKHAKYVYGAFLLDRLDQ
jgi:hypothetical protein